MRLQALERFENFRLFSNSTDLLCPIFLSSTHKALWLHVWPFPSFLRDSPRPPPLFQTAPDAAVDADGRPAHRAVHRLLRVHPGAGPAHAPRAARLQRRRRRRRRLGQRRRQALQAGQSVYDQRGTRVQSSRGRRFYAVYKLKNLGLKEEMQNSFVSNQVLC